MLKGDVSPWHPAAPVSKYALEWWSNPPEDAVDLISNVNILDCLEYHCTKRIQEGRPPQPVTSTSRALSCSPRPESIPAGSNIKLTVPLPPNHDPFLGSLLHNDSRSPSPDREFLILPFNCDNTGISSATLDSGAHVTAAPLTPSPDRMFDHLILPDLVCSGPSQLHAQTPSPVRSSDEDFSHISSGPASLAHPGLRSPSPDRSFPELPPLRTLVPDRSIGNTSHSSSPNRDFIESPGMEHEPSTTPSPDRSFHDIHVNRSPSPDRDFPDFPLHDATIIPDGYDDDEDSVIHGGIARPSGPYTEDMFAEIPTSILE